MITPIWQWYLDPVLTGGASSNVLIEGKIPWMLNLVFISFSLWYHECKKQKTVFGDKVTKGFNRPNESRKAFMWKGS